jgi:two-component system response regulator HydG
VKVNCAALHENLLESELFGHERGAFTGAEKLRIGRFEQADKGTIFLDEIGDMSSTTQAKVLRVLQEQEFERLGSSGRSVKVDVRVVTATNRELRDEVKEGRFRQDLYFRLNVVNLRIPPLRERLDDILPLARFFLNQYAVDFKKKVSGFSPEAIEKIRRYAWPGNVRELQNSIERAVLLSDDETIGSHNLTLEGRTEGESEKSADTMNLEELERGAIERALRATHGVQKDAADLLGVTPRVLNYKIAEMRIDWKSFRER